MDLQERNKNCKRLLYTVFNVVYAYLNIVLGAWLLYELQSAGGPNDAYSAIGLFFAYSNFVAILLAGLVVGALTAIVGDFPRLGGFEYVLIGVAWVAIVIVVFENILMWFVLLVAFTHYFTFSVIALVWPLYNCAVSIWCGCVMFWTPRNKLLRSFCCPWDETVSLICLLQIDHCVHRPQT